MSITPSRNAVDAVLFERPREAFLVFDDCRRIVHAPDSINDMLALPPTSHSVEGMGVYSLLAQAAGSRADFLPALERWLNGDCGSVNEPLLLHTADGRSLHGTVRRLDENYRIAAFTDITDEGQQTGASAITTVYKDHLTGIGNRALFEDCLDRVSLRLTTGELDSAIVFFLDLDRFKIVNDTLGHAIGDDLLCLVSERLNKELGSSGTLARMGGDEFAILIAPSPDEEAVRKLAKRFIDLVQRTYLIEGHVVHVGASIGIALAPKDGTTRKQLLKRADLALYESKASGRGLFNFFASAMEDKAERRRALETDLRKALVLRQFEMHYQPQIDAGTRKITGLEALLRWRHPKRGLVLPSEFIALAEEIGMSIPIGEWVLKTICQEAKRWPTHLTVATNVSPHQFEMSDFAASIQRALVAAGIEGNRIEVEVTEDLLLRNAPSVPSTLEALNKMGVRVILDGFGTGVASLGQLVKLPFSKIKIDSSLISLQNENVSNRAIVRAISALGYTLGISTLAEGVESKEHLAHVQSEGCQTVQGFYYSEAVPASELGEFFLQLETASDANEAKVTDE